MEWISVEDMVPELKGTNQEVCCLVTNGAVIHMAYYTLSGWHFCESGQIKEPMFYDVTHWMPLPEPPEAL